MRTYLDCYPCFVRQALEAVRMVTSDEGEQHRLINKILEELRRFEPTRTPPEMADRIHRIVRRETGVVDPYREAKETSNRQAITFLPRLREMVDSAEDQLDAAVRVSVAGNIIDLGVSPDYDLEETVDRILDRPWAINDLDHLRRELPRADRILYLADNAGETVFDRVLIETLDRPMDYVVRGGPILNDATIEDARFAGLDSLATIVENGSDLPGTVLDLCSPEFRRLFGDADLILAKGQGNFETLSDVEAPLYFLLQTKCPVIARHLDVPVRSIVAKKSSSFSTQA